MSLTLIFPPAQHAPDSARLEGVLRDVRSHLSPRVITRACELKSLSGGPVLFALPLGAVGINLEYVRMLEEIRRNPQLLARCRAGLIVDGQSEFYTKSAASELALALNCSGCALIGCPLVEATGDLRNFRIQAKNRNRSLMETYHAEVNALVQRLLYHRFPRRAAPKLLALHASTLHVSNTMDLWEGVKQRLEGQCDISEIGLRNGTLSDCSGCPYTMCLHFGEQGGCFYGGVMSEEVYPAVRRCDAIVMIAPNYNDALGANLTAFINRLTALFRQTRFYDKALFAIVASGYSGGDIVARQMICALCMNKSFYLPPRFALIETANFPGEAKALPGIQPRLDAFAETILATFQAG